MVCVCGLVVDVFFVFDGRGEDTFRLPRCVCLTPCSERRERRCVRGVFGCEFDISCVILLLPVLVATVVDPSGALAMSKVICCVYRVLMVTNVLCYASFSGCLNDIGPNELAVFSMVVFVSTIIITTDCSRGSDSLSLIRVLVSLIVNIFFVSVVMSYEGGCCSSVIHYVTSCRFTRSGGSGGVT